jgi:hypothetical protein
MFHDALTNALDFSNESSCCDSCLYPYRRLSELSITVLTAVFNILKSVMCEDPTSMSPVQSTLRSSVDATHYFDLMNLGRIIEDTLLFIWSSSDAKISCFSSTLDQDINALWCVMVYRKHGNTYTSLIRLPLLLQDCGNEFTCSHW